MTTKSQMKVKALGDVYRIPADDHAGIGDRSEKASPAAAADKLSLETYLLATDSPTNWSSFIRPEISQIVAMHGYCTLAYKLKKVDMMDMLRGIELISPQRSTLEDDYVSPGYAVSEEEMKRDLAALDWGDCELQSVESLRSTTPPPPKPDQPGGHSGLLSLYSAASTSNKRRRTKRTRTHKKKKIAAAAEASPSPSPAAAPVSLPEVILISSSESEI